MKPRVYFQKAREAYALAERQNGAMERRLELAGHGLRVKFASQKAAELLMPALAHRASDFDSASESLELLVWDSASTGVFPPPPPWSNGHVRARGEILGFDQDGVRTAFHPGPNVLSMYDASVGIALYWTPDATVLPDYLLGSPFLHILHWWAENHRLTLIHAGAVGNGKAGVLLAGAGGSGKSTTALACALSGMQYVSDDYCLLETSGQDTAHSVFNTGKLDSHSLTLLPFYRSLIAEPIEDPDQKGMVFLYESMSDQVVASLPISVVLLPNPSGGTKTGIRPASAGEALRALAPSTIFQLSGAGSHALRELGGLMRRVPCYHLDLSEHMQDAPDVVNAMLEQFA